MSYELKEEKLKGLQISVAKLRSAETALYLLCRDHGRQTSALICYIDLFDKLSIAMVFFRDVVS
jgi:hypothetical protein